ncbi:hypothetical protein [Pararhizobium sp.]|uniref:hypothetical protein n=1 Tax=Pararhizobium sp. TaxID=1977563 RepID=UPI003D0ABCF3
MTKNKNHSRCLTRSQTVHAALFEIFLELAQDALASARSAADVQEAQDSLLKDIASLGNVGGAK